jgi:hypothetical protein
MVAGAELEGALAPPAEPSAAAPPSTGLQRPAARVSTTVAVFDRKRILLVAYGVS